LRLLILLPVVALLITGVALAAPTGPNRIAVYVEGADAKAIRKDIVRALPDSVSVVDEGKTEGALRAAGVKGHVTDFLSKEDQRKKTAAKLDKVAARLGAGSIVVASVPKGKSSRDILVMVVRGKNEILFDTVTIDATDGPASISYKWESFVAAAIPGSEAAESEKKEAVAKDEPEAASDRPPAPEEKKRSAPRDEDVTPERDSGAGAEAEPSKTAGYDRSLVVFGLAYDSMTRGFSFKDPVTSNLRPYDVANVPGVTASVELYPLARSHGPVLPDLGITARMARALPFDSNTSNGQGASTTWQEVEVGLRGRIHTGSAGTSPLLGLGLAYSSSVFDFDGSLAAADLPSADYKMMRAEFDGRIPFGSFAALAELDYLQVLDVSPLGDRFTHESVHGVGARAGFAARALPWLEGRLELRYDHIFYKMNPEPGDKYVAGGALDQRFSISAGGAAYF